MRINSERYLADLTELRGFGAVSTGVVRPAFSEPDVAAREWLAGKFADIGLTPHFDPAGNLFGLPDGDAPCLMIGSHTDSQPEGGWLDGAFGVIAALEVARAAAEAGGPRLAVVSFQDEEGRFGPLAGSSAWTGARSLADSDRLTDASGLTFGEARRSMAHLCSGEFLPVSRFTGFVEPHIEQGPYLEESGEKVGVVDRIVGARLRKIRFIGQQNHAGTTPMRTRRDAFQGVVAFAERLNAALTPLAQPATVWTIGRVEVKPNAPSIVPGVAEISVQWRDVEAERLDAMGEAINAAAQGVSEERGLGLEIEERGVIAPRAMDARVVEALERAAQKVAPGAWRRMPSGAMHDAGAVAAALPAAMIFAPSIGGISHDFAEDSKLEDLVIGAETLAAVAEELG